MDWFNPVSAKSPPSRLDAELRLSLTRLHLEMQERREAQVREFELPRELELKKLEAETAIKMRQIELMRDAVRSPVDARSSSETRIFE